MNNGHNGNEKCEVVEKNKCLYNINGWCNRFNIECNKIKEYDTRTNFEDCNKKSDRQ
jgi:hypothetical protein